MAQSHPIPQRVESITDLTHDLDLLFPNGYGPVCSMVAGTQMRQIRIQELKRTRGTVQQVGLSITVTIGDRWILKTCRSMQARSICRVITATRNRVNYKKNWHTKH